MQRNWRVGARRSPGRVERQLNRLGLVRGLCYVCVARIFACKEIILATGLRGDGRERSPSQGFSLEARQSATQILSEIETELSRLPENMAPDAVRIIQELQQIVGELHMELSAFNQRT